MLLLDLLSALLCLLRSLYCVEVERYVQEAIWVAHVHLEPVDGRVQLHGHTLANHCHFWLCNFDLLCIYVLAEKDRELINENLAARETELFLLPSLELWIQFIHARTILSNWLIRNLSINLHISMVQVAQDSNCVALEVSDGS